MLTNDSDPDGDALTVIASDALSVSGAVVSVGTDGVYTYDPSAAAVLQALSVGETVADTFTYTISDGNGGTDSATVTIGVTGFDEPSSTGFVSVGTPFQVNTMGGTQRDPDVAELAGGGFVVAWRDEVRGSFGQIFDAGGAPVGSGFQVTSGSSQQPDVVGLTNGNFVVVTPGAGQVFDPSGAPVGAGFTISGGNGSQAVSALSGGGFVVTGLTLDIDGNGSPDPAAQIFDATGTSVSVAFSVPSVSHGAVAARPDGGFVAVWVAYGDGQDVVAQIFDASGIALGPQFIMKNRFYQVPHCNGSGTEKPGTQAAFRAMKAEGGWGAVCTEACSIDRESDITPNTLASLWDDGDIINLRHMCDALHKWDALSGVELWYGGGESADLYSRDVPRSVGQWTSDYAGAVYTHTMDEDDIREVQQLYVDAAKRAIQAGFDIVYVYGSHSTVVMHFLSPFYNKREDNYGGSLENRARMWLETLAKVREACDGQAAVVTRMSVDQVMGPDGIQAQVEGVGFIEMVEKQGLVDLWDINICDFLEWGEDAGSSRFYKANHQHAFTKHIREAVKSPMLNVGRFTSPDDMAGVIGSGQCDIIGSARGSIADPFLPNKIYEGRVEDVRECIGCNVCLSRWERGTPMVCTQNPVANEEFRRGWHPEKFDRVADAGSVLVVGAGPSGLEAARVLGMRGYDVHLVEAEKELGGHMKNVMRYPGLAEWGRVVSYRQTQLDKLKNVEIHTGRRLSADDVLSYGADKVIVATGFAWSGDGTSHITMAPIPGVDASQAQFLTPEQVMAGKATGDRVVVLDAENYFTGIGMAELMADQGKQVSLVTQTGNPARMTEFTLEAPNIHRMLHEKGIRSVTNSWVEECEVGNEIKVKVFNLYRDGYRRSNDPVSGELPRTVGGEHEIITADSVIVVTARASNDALFKELKERKGEWAGQEIAGIYLAGDAYAPRMLADAIYDGHRMAREFEEPNPRRSKPFLRERMIWGNNISPTA